jgi:hypothetical protein
MGVEPIRKQQSRQLKPNLADDATNTSTKAPHTVSDAARLLRDCQVGLRELLQESNTKEISVRLNRLESFQSDPRKCRVLYAEPEQGSKGVETLHELACMDAIEGTLPMLWLILCICRYT